MYVITQNDHALVIDPSLDTLPGVNLSIDLMIVTHEHYDHISGVNAWKKKYNVSLLCSEACAARITDAKMNQARHFDTFCEILDEIKVRIDENKITLKESENKLILNIPLPTSKSKEIIFELNPIIKNNDDRLNELTDLIVKLNTEMNIIKNENMQLKNEEIINLKNEIKQLNDKYKNLENK